MKCWVNWAAFDLEDDIGPCESPAITIARQACVHEHVTESPACDRCAAYLRSLASPDEWWCGRCLRLHGECHAELTFTPVRAASNGHGGD